MQHNNSGTSTAAPRDNQTPYNFKRKRETSSPGPLTKTVAKKAKVEPLFTHLILTPSANNAIETVAQTNTLADFTNTNYSQHNDFKDPAAPPPHTPANLTHTPSAAQNPSNYPHYPYSGEPPKMYTPRPILPPAPPPPQSPHVPTDSNGKLKGIMIYNFRENHSYTPKQQSRYPFPSSFSSSPSNSSPTSEPLSTPPPTQAGPSQAFSRPTQTPPPNQIRSTQEQTRTQQSQQRPYSAMQTQTQQSQHSQQLPPSPPQTQQRAYSSQSQSQQQQQPAQRQARPITATPMPSPNSLPPRPHQQILTPTTRALPPQNPLNPPPTADSNSSREQSLFNNPSTVLPPPPSLSSVTSPSASASASSSASSSSARFLPPLVPSFQRVLPELTQPQSPQPTSADAKEFTLPSFKTLTTTIKVGVH